MKAMRFGEQIEIDPEDGRKKMGVSQTCGAIVWPKDGAPAYCCLFGQELRSHVRGKRPIIFITEFESPLLSEAFFEKILIDSRSVLCRAFYGFNSSGDGALPGGFRLFDRYMSSQDANVRLYAPAICDWETSIHIIRSWDIGKVLIGITNQTILGRQLGQITRESLHESQAPNFYAVNALRCLIDEVESGSAGFNSAWVVEPPPDGGWA